jgi:hypothetical protein
MTEGQKNQLQRIEPVLFAMVAELDPRVIMPDLEKQQALGLAEETMLVPVGAGRALTASATENGGWTVKEFDTSSGQLIEVWNETGRFSDELLVNVFLGAAVRVLLEQIARGGADTATLLSLHTLLKARYDKFIEQGPESFEYETVGPTR